MKLLFDQNLSSRLVKTLADIFPGSTHLRFEGLERASDKEVWNFASTRDLVIVTKDGDDFHPMSVRLGWPPKVIWLRAGNCSTRLVEEVLRDWLPEIRKFGRDKETAMLVIGQRPPSVTIAQ